MHTLDTHELLLFALVLDLDDRLVVLSTDLEWPVYLITLNLGVVDLATNETLGVEDGVLGIGVICVLRGITNAMYLW